MFTRTGGKLVWNGGFQEYKTTCRNWDEPDFSWDPFNGDLACRASCLPGMCDRSEFNIRGFVFAGQVGGRPNVWFRLEQDQSVKHAAVTRRYYRSFVGEPVDWMEIEPPASLPKL